jgi:hypothetical protein
MRKKTIVAVIVILFIAIGLSYTYIDKIENAWIPNKPALKLTMITDYNDTGDFIVITNMTFEQTSVPVFYRSVDSPVVFPDINVEGRNDTITTAPVTYWASAKRVKTNETYEFTLTFREPYVPKPGDMLILTVRMNDFRGKLEYKTTAFYGWK